MGFIFSGSYKVSRSYEVVSLKTNDKLADDLWKNTNLRLKAAYLEGGVKKYMGMKKHMYKMIRKKYSTKYMVDAGAAVVSTMDIYDFSELAVQRKLSDMYNDAGLEVVSIGEPAYAVADVTVGDTSFSGVVDVVGDTFNIKGKIKDPATGSFVTDKDGNDEVYNFFYESGKSKNLPVGGSGVTKNVTELFREYVDGSIPYWTYRHKEVTVELPYSITTVYDMIGTMHAEDVVRYLTSHANSSYWWASSVNVLAGTLEVGSLVSTYKVTTEILEYYPLSSFNIEYAVTGQAKGLDKVTTVTSSTEDKLIAFSYTEYDDPVVVEIIDSGFYDKGITAEQDNGIVASSAAYSASGDRIQVVTTRVKTEYIKGFRDSGDGTTIDTVTTEVTTTVSTDYKVSNYTISVSIESVADTAFDSVVNGLLMPAVTHEYTGYVALDDIDTGASYTFECDGSNGNLGKLRIDAHGPIIMSEIDYTHLAGITKYKVYEESTQASMSVSSMHTLLPKVIQVSCVSGAGNSMTGRLVVTDDLYTVRKNVPLTPIIPIKSNSTSYTYKNTPVLQAKDYVSSKLSVVYASVIEVGANAPSIIVGSNGIRYTYTGSEDSSGSDETYYYYSNSLDTSMRDTIITACDGGRDNAAKVDTVDALHAVIEKYRSEISHLITVYGNPNVDSVDSILATVDGFTAKTNSDSRSENIRKVLKTLGMPAGGQKDGLDAIMKSVSSSDVFSASVVVGLTLFEDADGTKLISTNSNARAKVMWSFADLLVGHRPLSDTGYTLNLSASNLKMDYKYTIEKRIVPDFVDSAEYAAAVVNGVGNFMISSNDEIYSYFRYSGVHGVSHSVPIHRINLNVFKLLGDGTAMYYKFTEISVTMTNKDGTYSLTTKGSYSSNILNLGYAGMTDLDQLLIVYPDELNWKLSLREYSSLYSKNLFLFVYARHATYVEWYESGFFGFVLFIAALIISVLTFQYEVAAAAAGVMGLSAGELFVIGLVVGMASSMGLSMFAPDMNPYVRMAISAALSFGAAAGTSAGTSSIGGSAVGSMSVDEIVTVVMNGVKDYFTGNSFATLLGDAVHYGSMVEQIVMDEKTKDMMDKYGEQIKVIHDKTAKLMLENKKNDIAGLSTGIFANHIREMNELTSYDPVGLPDWLVNSTFSPGLLEYMSSTQYQSDIASIDNILSSPKVLEVMSPVINPGAPSVVL